MASQADSPCFADAPPIAAEVARGVTRLFCRQDLFAVCEMPLPNGRRADLMAIDGKGGLTIGRSVVEVVGDNRAAVPSGASTGEQWNARILEAERYLPREAGLIVADRYDAAVIREAAHRPMPPARRKAELLRFARRAARRLSAQVDPSLGESN